MIHSPEYIKALLRKQMRGSITREETDLLLLAWDLYDNEELEAMVKELEAELPHDQLPGQEIKKWKDFAKKVVDRDKAEKNWRIGKWSAKVIAVVCLLTIGIVIVWKIKQNSASNKILCENTGPGEIPTRLFFCVLQPDQPDQLKVDSTKSGVIRKMGAVEIVQQVPGLIEYRLADGVMDASGEQVIRTSAMQQYLVKLSDGTLVRMNAATTIRFPAVFEGENRKIQIEGEVYIDAPLNKTFPLTIQTTNASITGAGGKLNINTFRYGTIAFLEQGDVFTLTDSSHQQTTLSATEMIQAAKVGQTPSQMRDSFLVIEPAHPKYIMGWKNTERVYRNRPVIEYIMDMCHWYGLKLKDARCIKDIRISATVCYQASVYDAIALLRKHIKVVALHGEQLSFCEPEKSIFPQPQTQQKGGKMIAHRMELKKGL